LNTHLCILVRGSRNFRFAKKVNSTSAKSLIDLIDEAQPLRRMRLVFKEAERERTQVQIRCSPASGEAKREILSQRWIFRPTGSTIEVED